MLKSAHTVAQRLVRDARLKDSVRVRACQYVRSERQLLEEDERCLELWG